jgi:hypothetical protein
MMWKQPKGGETKQVTKFLWFPKTIENETRWLQRATYEIQYCDYSEWWIATRWISLANRPDHRCSRETGGTTEKGNEQ